MLVEIVPHTLVGPFEIRLLKVAVLLAAFGSVPCVPSSAMMAVFVIPVVPCGKELLAVTAKSTEPFAPWFTLPTE